MTRPRALALALLVLAAPRVASADPPPCLGPAIGAVLQQLVQAHAFADVVAPGYRLEHLDVKQDRLELGYDDDQGPAVSVVLTVLGSDRDAPTPDARGPHFEHRIVEARGRASGPARAAMLRAAKIVDDAIPSEEMRRCEGAVETAPANRGLAVGGAEAAVILAALAIGIGRRKRPPIPGR
jgi:hypothetical protein